MKPHGASHRVAIVRDAQAMNPEAANALLKLLEEPPERSLLILTTHRISDLLPTIVSRCQPVRFRPLGRETVADLLVEAEAIDRPEAAVLAMLGRGSVQRAMAMRKAGWVERRKWLIDAIDSLGDMPVNARLALAETISKDRDQLAVAIDLAAGWFRDLAVVLTAPEAVDHADMVERTSRTARRLGPERIEAGLRMLIGASRSLTANINARLTAEVLLMRLSALIYGTV